MTHLTSLMVQTLLDVCLLAGWELLPPVLGCPGLGLGYLSAQAHRLLTPRNLKLPDSLRQILISHCCLMLCMCSGRWKALKSLLRDAGWCAHPVQAALTYLPAHGCRALPHCQGWRPAVHVAAGSKHCKGHEAKVVGVWQATQEGLSAAWVFAVVETVADSAPQHVKAQQKQRRCTVVMGSLALGMPSCGALCNRCSCLDTPLAAPSLLCLHRTGAILLHPLRTTAGPRPGRLPAAMAAHNIRS